MIGCVNYYCADSISKLGIIYLEKSLKSKIATFIPSNWRFITFCLYCSDFNSIIYFQKDCVVCIAVMGIWIRCENGSLSIFLEDFILY